MTHTTPNSTLIPALHSRFEQATDTLDFINERRVAPADGRHGSYKATRLDAAARVVVREIGQLQDTILHQVPETWSEALILLFHARNCLSRFAVDTVRDDRTADRLQLSLEALFDFMCREVDAAHRQIGAAFQAEAAEVSTARRLRSGEAEL